MSNTKPKSIYQKLLEVQKVVDSANKNAENPFHKNKYADLESVIEACKGELNDRGIIALQPLEAKEDGNYLVTKLIDSESGETIESSIKLVLNKNDMQSLGSAITYARRYSIQSMIFMYADDDDGNKASDKPTGKRMNDKEFTDFLDNDWSFILAEKQKYQFSEKQRATLNEEYKKWKTQQN